MYAENAFPSDRHSLLYRRIVYHIQAILLKSLVVGSAIAPNPKHRAKRRRYPLLNLVTRRRSAKQLLQRGHAFVDDSTGDDLLEIAHVGRNIQREAMLRDAAGAQLHPNRRDLG